MHYNSTLRSEEIRVLFVDDEQSILEQGKFFLEKENGRLNVETTTSAKEALEMIDEGDFDAVISDYKMPVMDGLKLLETVRRERGSDIPFIIFTGKGREEVAMEALNLGADRYLRKGGSPRSQYGILAKSIVQEVQRQRAEEELKETGERFRTVFETTGVATVIIDEDMTISRANRRAGKLSGYPKGELKGKKWTEFVADKDLERPKEYYRTRSEKSEATPSTYEFKFVDRNDNVKHVLAAASMIPGTKEGWSRSWTSRSERRRRKD